MEKFLIKLVVNGIIVIPLLMWFGNASFGSAAVTAVVLCIVAYFLGDQLILRSSNNTVGVIADALLSFAFLWVVGYYMNWSLSFAELAIIAVVLGIAEAFFHRYLGYRDTEVR